MYSIYFLDPNRLFVRFIVSWLAIFLYEIRTPSFDHRLLLSHPTPRPTPSMICHCVVILPTLIPAILEVIRSLHHRVVRYFHRVLTPCFQYQRSLFLSLSSTLMHLILSLANGRPGGLWVYLFQPFVVFIFHISSCPSNVLFLNTFSYQAASLTHHSFAHWSLCLFDGHSCLHFIHGRSPPLACLSHFFLRFAALLSSFVVQYTYPLVPGRWSLGLGANMELHLQV